MLERQRSIGHLQLVKREVESASELPTCSSHPGSLVRRYRSHGPHGPGVYPQCVPAGDEQPHLLAWSQASNYGEATRVVASLSPSERAVLEDAALGLSASNTAVKRSKGVETVRTQRKRILLKLGARNMTHAVAMMIRHEPDGLRRAA